MKMDIIEDVEKWFLERPAWFQEAAKRIIENSEIKDADFEDLVAICKSEGVHSQLTPSKGEKCVVKVDKLVTKESKGTVHLSSISNPEGINALGPRKALEFGDSPLSIIYGQTGSGKTGYVRVLKHACGSRIPGALHTNVFENGCPEQSCTFQIKVDGNAEEIKWSPNIGVSDQLRPIEIYDRDATQIYVTEENEIMYEPPILYLFTQLADACEKVNETLQSEISQCISRKPKFSESFAQTKAAQWYNSLNHNTSESEIIENCNWNEDLDKTLTQLKNRLSESNPAEKAKAIRTISKNIGDIIGRLQSVADNLADGKCEKYISANSAAKAKKKAADEDVKKVFDGVPLEGVGTESWKLLWEQARRYSEEDAYPNVAFPNIGEDARCVLCHQLLSGEAKRRLKSFEDYVKGGLERETVNAQEQVKKLSDAFGEIPTEENMNLMIDSAGIVAEDERNRIYEYCRLLEERKSSVLNANSLSEVTPLPGKKQLTFLSPRIISLDGEAAVYEEDALRENREEHKTEIDELEAQKWLFQEEKAVKQEVERLKKVHNLQEAKRLTSTKSLSIKKSALSDELITKAFIKKFGTELTNLGASQIKVEMMKTGTQRGHVYHQIILKGSFKDVSTSEILSDGEFRIVSLAAFLADAEGKDSRATFVFDDPISSLDQDFEEATVSRLIEMCNTRQVVVFTHRLSMLSLLQEFAKKHSIDPHVVCLQREPWGIGEPADTPWFAIKPQKALNLMLSEQLPRARKALEESGQQEYEVLAKSICLDFRILLERVIENDLLADIVQRFRRDITTKGKIQKLALINEKDCQFFDEMMSKYSVYLHSQPNEAPVKYPPPDKLQEDMGSLKSWFEEFKKRDSAR